MYFVESSAEADYLAYVATIGDNGCTVEFAILFLLHLLYSDKHFTATDQCFHIVCHKRAQYLLQVSVCFFEFVTHNPDIALDSGIRVLLVCVKKNKFEVPATSITTNQQQASARFMEFK